MVFTIIIYITREKSCSQILESEYEKTLYNKAAIFKREVGPFADAPSTAANEKANEVHGGK